ncbi:N-acetylmuramoyl-L-alanine amidase family protein [Clostridium beijerinckii]|uniref:N-acetylmuramoyl-L-alanine amidase family protein n=1 Tax=Clostridium beijerinckii TaxID=1520 RepID=UPI001360CEB8|nr:N-acetylmuramoyl-L-alanine amidase family protein [Clostridium beijerinckii]MZK50673.1 hypothetical protein [Clostridium beijerinckii]MZK58877.1 hypothetical protein [Clostridium beijerinckii]MZK68996.1 hypothetical protein [Clostridium beijerinckii]MZK74368.1 hypothetical protein [Clostridium beijerinckii]MZK84068.1 hypothetical protein [Clostridium beijerinckii]
MKSLKLKKLVAVALAAMTIATVSPVGVSAAWEQDSTGWWNTEGDSYSIGWRYIDNSWYYFDSTGYMKAGWIQDRGTWYYLNPVSDGTKGAMKAGWIQDKGTWYYLNPVSDGTRGAMKTGWIKDGDKWYFAASSGAMQTGVIEVNGKIYYFAESGAMQTGNVTINGVTYTFAATGEAIGDKKPVPTLAFSGNGVATTVDTTNTSDTTTSSSDRHSSGGHSSSGTTYTDITSSISQIYSDNFASMVQNNPTLARNIKVTTGSAIEVKLLNTNLSSLQTVFNTVQGEDEALIKARLDKAVNKMNSYSTMVKVGGVSFKDYLALAEAKYKTSGGNSNYFNADGTFNTTEIARRIKNNTLTYDVFKNDLKQRVIAMCDETKQAPQISISYGIFSKTVTRIYKDGTGTIYDTGLSIDTNINNLINLGNDITGTYTVYCGNEYFKVVVTK